MFVLTQTLRFWWPVEVLLPHPTIAGRVQPQTCVIEFETIPQDQARALVAELKDLSEEDLASREHAELYRVVKGWRDVVDAQGGEVPFSEAALKAAMQVSWFRLALYRAYGRALAGDGEPIAKN